MEAVVNIKGLSTFFEGKRVLITGHTGFKGSWMVVALASLGAKVAGYSLPPPTEPALYGIAKLNSLLTPSILADIRDFGSLTRAFETFKPEIVFHLAAQPIVRVGYTEPRETYEANVMGTVNVLEACRLCSSVRSVVCITTDKVYENKEWVWGYRESDLLDGFDPYANSKSCSELVAACYNRAFFQASNVVLTTARAGNVIGGGDFALNRIIPDCVRAAVVGEEIIVRNPHSIRPYQHVLEPVFSYLMIAASQYKDKSYADCYNIGPNDSGCVTTGSLATMFCAAWGDNLKWVNKAVANAPHEANFLKLDCAKFKDVFQWQPVWSVKTAIEKTVAWSKSWVAGEDIQECMRMHIQDYTNDQKLTSKGNLT